MIFFLRTKIGETIFEVEYWINNQDGYEHIEISPTIDIRNYSLFLLSKQDFILKTKIISDFVDLCDLREWLWEVYFKDKKNTPEYYDDVLKELRNILNHVAIKYDLRLIED